LDPIHKELDDKKRTREKAKEKKAMFKMAALATVAAAALRKGQKNKTSGGADDVMSTVREPPPLGGGDGRKGDMLELEESTTRPRGCTGCTEAQAKRALEEAQRVFAGQDALPRL
jgi:hypothetical protein